MGELANCDRCDTVFYKTFRNVCQDCHKIEEEAFRTVYAFLREQRNRTAKVEEIVEATGVEEELISKFVREKRLTTKDFPFLTYPCELCGEGISEGKICEKCQKGLRSDLEVFEEGERQKEERKKNEKIYYSIDKHKR